MSRSWIASQICENEPRLSILAPNPYEYPDLSHGIVCPKKLHSAYVVKGAWCLFTDLSLNRQAHEQTLIFALKKSITEKIWRHLPLFLHWYTDYMCDMSRCWYNGIINRIHMFSRLPRVCTFKLICLDEWQLMWVMELSARTPYLTLRGYNMNVKPWSGSHLWKDSRATNFDKTFKHLGVPQFLYSDYTPNVSWIV